MTKLNSPKVNILNGKLMNFKIGLIKKLSRPKTPPARANICQFPVNSTPGTNLWAKKIPKIPPKICKNKFHIVITMFLLYQGFGKRANSLNFK